MGLKAVTFTTSQNWVCPVNVKIGWLTMCGGGGGSTHAADQNSDHGPTGGAGSSEIVINRIIPLVPGDTYSAVIGAGGLGSTVHSAQPGIPGNSSFAGFTALRAGLYNGNPLGPTNAGGGGGCGGSRGFALGGGVYPDGALEGGRYSGGCGGGGGKGEGQDYSADIPGNAGGAYETVGTGSAAYGGSGGAGAGTLWGGTQGAPAAANSSANASASHYGAGAGGSGVTSGTTSNGGNGAPGYILLLYLEE